MSSGSHAVGDAGGEAGTGSRVIVSVKAPVSPRPFVVASMRTLDPGGGGSSLILALVPSPSSSSWTMKIMSVACV